MSEVLFTRRITFRENGVIRSAQAIVFKPVVMQPGIETVCQLKINGVSNRVVEIRGVDEMQAVQLAINHVDLELSGLSDLKYEF